MEEEQSNYYVFRPDGAELNEGNMPAKPPKTAKEQREEMADADDGPIYATAPESAKEREARERLERERLFLAKGEKSEVEVRNSEEETVDEDLPEDST